MLVESSASKDFTGCNTSLTDNSFGPFGMALFKGAADRGAKKSTRKPNFGTFGPIRIYILSRNIKTLDSNVENELII